MKHYTESTSHELMALRKRHLPVATDSVTDLLELVRKVLDGSVVVGDLADLPEAQLVALAVTVCSHWRETCKSLPSFDEHFRRIPIDPTDPRETLATNVAQFLSMLPRGMAWIAIRDAIGGHENPQVTNWHLHFMTRRPVFMRLCLDIRDNMKPGGFSDELGSSKPLLQRIRELRSTKVLYDDGDFNAGK